MKKHPISRQTFHDAINSISLFMNLLEKSPIQAGYELGRLQKELLISMRELGEFEKDDYREYDEDEDEDEEDDDESQEDQIERLNNQIFALKENIKYKMQTINQLQKIINRLLECTKKSDSLSTDQD